MDQATLHKILRIAEEHFGSASHSEYIPITAESMAKLAALSPDCVMVEMAGTEPISWIVVIPTTKALMNKFISGQITERQMFNQMVPQQNYDALYLCSAFTVSKHRRQGLALKLFKQALDKFAPSPDMTLFAWPISKEGNQLVKKITEEFGQTIITRK